MHADPQSPHPSSSASGVACGDLVGLLEAAWKHLSASLVGMRISDPRWKPAVDWLNANRHVQKPIPRLPNADVTASLARAHFRNTKPIPNMKNDTDNTAGSDGPAATGSAWWVEYGEGPPKRGDYNIKVRSQDGREKTVTAWHNPGNGHWIADGKECGYVDIITPPGETEEWRITHWQRTRHADPDRHQEIMSIQPDTPDCSEVCAVCLDPVDADAGEGIWTCCRCGRMVCTGCSDDHPESGDTICDNCIPMLLDREQLDGSACVVCGMAIEPMVPIPVETASSVMLFRCSDCPEPDLTRLRDAVAYSQTNANL